jgi:4-amino-4-deoxy-L-arabinose transferase-like glycosyltransferase
VSAPVSATENTRANQLVFALVLLVFCFLLGTRSLNEPDEGRYGEIAREMVESGDWLAPHIWHVPHLDKPPMAYWLVALSIQMLGVNEWAVRLPLALAGLSGVWAAFLLARQVAGERAARWATLILSSSLLYFAMARMLTTDIFLAQFVAWAGYFFWRSWESLDHWKDVAARPGLRRQFLCWQMAMWAALAGGFLTKGPVALAIPLAAVAALTIFRWNECYRWKLQILGAVLGVPLFCLLAFPWFLLVFKSVPGSFDFMVRDRFAGHALGTTVKNRGGPLLYFVPILLVGFLPWTPLLGWLWRRAHWRALNERQKAGWLFLTVWVTFTFLLFSLNRSKLPAYILPLFPPLAVLVAWRWFGEVGSTTKSAPAGVWRAVLLAPFVMWLAIVLAFRFAFKITDQGWLLVSAAIAVALLIIFFKLSSNWSLPRRQQWSAGLAVAALFAIIAGVPAIETRLRSNQTLKPLGTRLRAEWRPGDAIVAWGQLPQGLPLAAHPLINATNRPYLGGIPFNRLPYEFPGNRERLGNRVLPDEAAFARLLNGDRRVLVVGFQGTFEWIKPGVTNAELKLLERVGRWELFVNR